MMAMEETDVEMGWEGDGYKAKKQAVKKNTTTEKQAVKKKRRAWTEEEARELRSAMRHVAVVLSISAVFLVSSFFIPGICKTHKILMWQMAIVGFLVSAFTVWRIKKVEGEMKKM